VPFGLAIDRQDAAVAMLVRNPLATPALRVHRNAAAWDICRVPAGNLTAP